MSGIGGRSPIRRLYGPPPSMCACVLLGGTRGRVSYCLSRHMTFVCLWIPAWSTGAASSAEAVIGPRPPDGADAAAAAAGAGEGPPLDRLTEALLRVSP